MIIVQHIIVEWTKDQRGAEAATRRNAAPDVLALPDQRPDPATVMIYHAVGFDGRCNFNQTHETLKPYAAIQRNIGCVALRLEDASLAVRFVYSWYNAGAPNREQHRCDIGTLATGQWAKIAYNGRFSYEPIWIYRYQTINVGLFDAYAPNVFLDTQPTYRYRQLAKLK